MITTGLENLLESLGLDGRISGKNYMTLCPFHRDANPSFGVEMIPPYRYGCFSCGEAGNIVKLVMKIRGCGFKEASRMVARYVVFDFTPISDTYSMPSDPDDAVLWFYQYKLTKNKRARAYLRGRGMSDGAMGRLSLGYDPKKKSIVFPLTDVFTGKIRGFYYRGVRGKYKNVEGPKTRLVIVPPFYKKADAIFVCEGPFDMHRVMQYRRVLGFPNATAVSVVGAHVTKEQLTFISDYPTIIWALDQDYAGRTQMRKSKPIKSRQYVLEYDATYEDSDPDTAENFRIADYTPIEEVQLPSHLRR